MLVDVKCTHCGAETKVEDSVPAAVCPGCGEAFVTQKAAANYQEAHPPVKPVEGIDLPLEDRAVYATVCLTELGEPERAAALFESITREAPENHRGWWGLALVATENFTKMDISDKTFSQIRENAERALKLAPPEEVARLALAWQKYEGQVRGGSLRASGRFTQKNDSPRKQSEPQPRKEPAEEKPRPAEEKPRQNVETKRPAENKPRQAEDDASVKIEELRKRKRELMRQLDRVDSQLEEKKNQRLVRMNADSEKYVKTKQTIWIINLIFFGISFFLSYSGFLQAYIITWSITAVTFIAFWIYHFACFKKNTSRIQGECQKDLDDLQSEAEEKKNRLKADIRACEKELSAV